MQLLDPGSALTEPIDLNDYITSKQMGEDLVAAYPGYRWGVRVQWNQGVADVFCLDVPTKYGWRIHLRGRHADQMFSASALKARVLAAGGEILERFNLPRSKFNADRYETAPVDFKGDIVGDTSK